MFFLLFLILWNHIISCLEKKNNTLSHLRRRSWAWPPSPVCRTRRSASHRNASPGSWLSLPCRWPYPAEQRKLAKGRQTVRHATVHQRVCFRFRGGGETHWRRRTWFLRRRSGWTSRRRRSGRRTWSRWWCPQSMTWLRGSWRPGWRSSKLERNRHRSSVDSASFVETNIIKCTLDKLQHFF